MALTRDFHETVRARARRDPEYRGCLLKEGVQCLLAGEVDVAKIILRDYVEAMIGFEQLGTMTGKPPESLRRMLDLESTPHVSDLLEVLARILRHEGLALQVSTIPGNLEADDPVAS